MSTITTRQSILVRGDIENGQREGIAGADAILPGTLLQYNATQAQTDDEGAMIPNAAAGKRAEVAIAFEDDFLGMSITGARPDSTNLGYYTGDVIRFRNAVRGDLVQVILKSGNNAAASAYLTPDGTGKFKIANGTTDYNMVRIVNAVDATAADKLATVEVL